MTKNNIKHTPNNIDENFRQELQAIFAFETKDGKTEMPDGNLPDFAKKRCDWALQFVDMGLNFLGELEFALALDETEAKKEFEIGASVKDWMPVSEEFRNWINGPYNSMHQMRVALYLIYGDSNSSCEEEAE